ncbi:MAG: triose-phosphate isomerase [Nanoarchaeota archaeon]|nr:triose-phosphate isomerase [Nanoarchaeota archaeon]
MLFVNFKNYVFGEKSVKLAKECKKVNNKIVLGVGLGDLYRIVKETKMKCYVQHIDYQGKGRNTGYNLVENVKANNGKGVMLNHSEHRLSFEIISKTVKRCKQLNLEIMVFVKNINEGKKVSRLKPSYICVEPPKLVGGKVSVSTANPKLIEDSVKKINGRILVGAGIHSKRDVEVARKLGAKGVAVSSAVTTARNPGKVLKELI